MYRTGKVLWFSRDRGYGFIWPDPIRGVHFWQEEIFFHHSKILGAEKKQRIKKGRRVKFTFRKTTLGKEATEVKLL